MGRGAPVLGSALPALLSSPAHPSLVQGPGGGWQVPWGPFQAWSTPVPCSLPVPGTTLSSERIYPQPSCWGAAALYPLPAGRVGRLRVRSGRSGGAFLGEGSEHGFISPSSSSMLRQEAAFCPAPLPFRREAGRRAGGGEAG